MFVLRIWSVLCLFAFVSLNEVENDLNCAENYDNEIPLDEPEEDTLPVVGTCQDDTSRWDKLFTALEDSHMRQNMLLSSMEQCTSLLPLKTSKGPCYHCATNMEKNCKTQAEQIYLKLRQDLQDILHYGIENERRMNLTMEQLLYKTHETNNRLKRLEDGQKNPKPRPTMWPFGTETTFTSSSSNGPKEQDTNLLRDMDPIGKALVAIATELQKVQLQLSKVIEETRRKDRGDT